MCNGCAGLWSGTEADAEQFQEPLTVHTPGHTQTFIGLKQPKPRQTKSSVPKRNFKVYKMSKMRMEDMHKLMKKHELDAADFR